MSYTITKELGSRLDPKIVMQAFSKLTPLQDGMEMKNVFKRSVNVRDRVVAVKDINKTIKSIPYVNQAVQGSNIGGGSEVSTLHEVPPMKAHARIFASEIGKAISYNKIEFNAWLQEKLMDVRTSMDYSMEFLKRSMLTNGNLSYKYDMGKSFDTFGLSLGTMVAGGTVSTKWDAAAKTLEGVYVDIDKAVRAAQAATASSIFFNDPSQIVTYLEDTTWYNIFAKLNGRDTLDTVQAKKIGANAIDIGGYVLKRFPGKYLDGETQASVQAVTDKTVRIVDTSAAAQHTMALLELDNLNAINSSQKHLLVKTIIPDHGEYLDIMLQFKPVPLFTPEAAITMTVRS